MSGLRPWHLLTGEYPPRAGGVSDYTHQLAGALAARGDEVHVWTPGEGGEVDEGAVRVHRFAGGFGPRGLHRLGRGLDAQPRPGRLVAQYTPDAFGFRAMNPLLPAWFATRRRERRWVIFHEVAYPFGAGRPQHELRALVTHLAAAGLGRSASAVFASCEAWVPVLGRLGVDRVAVLPVPSNLPTAVDAAAVEALRASLGAEVLLGTFSTYGGPIAPLLEPILRALLADHPGRKAILLGRGAEAFAARLSEADPRLRGALLSRPGLPAAELALHLACCDLVVQPYPDGLTTRRSTAMAALALGRPLASNRGPLTEGVWDESPAAVALADAPEGIPAICEPLLASPAARAELGERAVSFYRARASLEHTVKALRAAASAEDEAR